MDREDARLVMYGLFTTALTITVFVGLNEIIDVCIVAFQGCLATSPIR